MLLLNFMRRGNDKMRIKTVLSGWTCAVFLLTEKSYRNLVKPTRNQIVFTIFRLIWIQTDDRLDPNRSENSKYNLI